MTAEWPLIRLDDVFDIARGGSPRPIEDYITNEPGGLNWVRIGDASSSEKYIYRTNQKIKPSGLNKTRRVNVGDFLLTNSMSFGRPYIMGTDGCIHDGWLVLKPRRTELVHTNYFYHLLGSDVIYRQFAARASGSTVKNLNTDIVSSVEVRLPPPNEQRRIAAILDKADALRRKRKHAVELLDELRHSVFVSMFGDLTKLDGPWPYRSLSEVSTRITVGIVVKPASYYQQDGVPAIRSLNIRENGFDLSELVRISASDNEGALSKSRIFEGDVVIVRTGQPGKAAVVSTELNGANAIDVLILSPKKSHVNSQFVCDIINSEVGRRMVLANKRGQIQQHLNAGALKSAKIPIPPVHLQQSYLTRTNKQRRLGDLYRAHISALEGIFLSLQHRAFTGQL